MGLSELYNHLKTLTSQWHYLKSEIIELMNGKSDINHSHDNATTSTSGFMTSADKAKLDGISNQANKTDVDSSLNTSSSNPVRNSVIALALNSTTAKITDLTTKLNNLDADDIVFSDNTVGYTLNMVLEHLNNLTNVDLLNVVTSLPTASIGTLNQLYLVANSENTENNRYNIYITVEKNGSYSWEKVDDANLQLSNYLTETSANSTYATKSHSHGNLTNTGAIGTASGKLVVTTTNGVLTTGTSLSTNIKNSAALGNIGSSANATQSDINNLINTKIGNINTSLNGKMNNFNWIDEIDNIVQQLINYGE